MTDDRRALALAGVTVVANYKLDNGPDGLIPWAEAQGRLVRVDHWSRWGNYAAHLRDESDDEERRRVIAAFRERRLPKVLPRIGELAGGKVLACHCHPLPCHADVLAAAANEATP